jgi:hypothetical protein
MTDLKQAKEGCSPPPSRIASIRRVSPEEPACEVAQWIEIYLLDEPIHFERVARIVLEVRPSRIRAVQPVPRPSAVRFH